MNNNILKIIDNDGIEKEYKILCAFELAETEKNYVVYTDNSKNENGEVNVYASIYDPNDETKLEDIQTDIEWEAVEEVLKELNNRKGE